MALGASNDYRNVYSGLLGTALAAGALSTRWEGVKFIGQCVLTALACRVLDNFATWHQYPQYFTGEPYQITTYPRLNAFVSNLHRTWTFTALASSLFSLVATAPFPLMKRQVTLAPYFPYFIATIGGLFILHRLAIINVRIHADANNSDFIRKKFNSLTEFDPTVIGIFTLFTAAFVLDARTV